MYIDPTLAYYGEMYNKAKTEAEKAQWHAAAEAYRMQLNSGYRGSVDGSTFTGPASIQHAGTTIPSVPNTAEKVAENVETRTRTTADPSEAIGQANGGSNGQIPSSNLSELKNAPDQFSMGKTTTGLTYVFGNLLDSVWVAFSDIWSTAKKYAVPILWITGILVGSKMFSYHKKA